MQFQLKLCTCVSNSLLKSFSIILNQSNQLWTCYIIIEWGLDFTPHFSCSDNRMNLPTQNVRIYYDKDNFWLQNWQYLCFSIIYGSFRLKLESVYRLYLRYTVLTRNYRNWPETHAPTLKYDTASSHRKKFWKSFVL